MFSCGFIWKHVSFQAFFDVSERLSFTAFSYDVSKLILVPPEFIYIRSKILIAASWYIFGVLKVFVSCLLLDMQDMFTSHVMEYFDDIILWAFQSSTEDATLKENWCCLYVSLKLSTHRTFKFKEGFHSSIALVF